MQRVNVTAYRWRTLHWKLSAWITAAAKVMASYQLCGKEQPGWMHKVRGFVCLSRYLGRTVNLLLIK